MRVRSREYGIEESVGNVPIEQPVANLYEYRWHTDRIIGIQAHERAEE